MGISKENIANYVRRCMFAYLEGSAVGQELDDKVKSFK